MQNTKWEITTYTNNKKKTSYCLIDTRYNTKIKNKNIDRKHIISKKKNIIIYKTTKNKNNNLINILNNKIKYKISKETIRIIQLTYKNSIMKLSIFLMIVAFAAVSTATALHRCSEQGFRKAITTKVGG